MKFRQRLFWFLAFCALGWIAYGLSATGRAVETVGATATSDAEMAGIGLGASLSTGVFLCTGLPLFLLFAIVAWRNGAGIRAERRHQELLAAQRGNQQ